ncbi:hypothetical protein BDZ94DRAFT_865664 [Collybia nuda]|uniref:Uncharacterized protein n=1 Tax=Collybia nuda TaxID=64659 RepID=A0A9P5Y245_9AGAR|nr:hypothetical protein BDZ94DRAFT_865664 [Collybia nuda]
MQRPTQTSTYDLIIYLVMLVIAWCCCHWLHQEIRKIPIRQYEHLKCITDCCRRYEQIIRPPINSLDVILQVCCNSVALLWNRYCPFAY